MAPWARRCHWRPCCTRVLLMLLSRSFGTRIGTRSRAARFASAIRPIRLGGSFPCDWMIRPCRRRWPAMPHWIGVREKRMCIKSCLGRAFAKKLPQIRLQHKALNAPEPHHPSQQAFALAQKHKNSFCFRISFDGRRVPCVFTDGSYRIFDAATTRCVSSIKVPGVYRY